MIPRINVAFVKMRFVHGTLRSKKKSSPLYTEHFSSHLLVIFCHFLSPDTARENAILHKASGLKKAPPPPPNMMTGAMPPPMGMPLPLGMSIPPPPVFKSGPFNQQILHLKKP